MLPALITEFYTPGIVLVIHCQHNSHDGSIQVHELFQAHSIGHGKERGQVLYMKTVDLKCRTTHMCLQETSQYFGAAFQEMSRTDIAAISFVSSNHTATCSMIERGALRHNISHKIHKELFLTVSLPYQSLAVLRVHRTIPQF
jgi:hypothetical protein